MKKYRLRDKGWRLVNQQTGEIADIDFTFISRNRGGSFMKMWQNITWENRVKKLQGMSVKVLYMLIGRADYGNTVPGASELARQVGMHRTAVTRAYKELTESNILIKGGLGYFLNPYFCWKGNEQQYEAILKLVTVNKVPELVKG